MPVGKRRATYAELCEVPDTMVAEILDGELIATPRPASPHARAATVMGSDLLGQFDRPPGDPAGGPGGWWMLFEPELHLGDDVVVPDLAAWRRDHLPVLPDVAAFTQAPDWVCEVVSPTTVTIDRARKMRIYARERIAHLWLLDPLQRTLEVFRLEDDHWLVAAVHAGTDAVRAEPFAAVALQLARWWLD